MSTIAVIVHFFTLAAVIAGSTVWKPVLWGVNWWGSVSLPALTVLSVLSLLFITEKPARLLEERKSSESGKSLPWKFIIPIVSIILMIIFRFRHTLTSGMMALAEQAENGTFYSPGEVIPALINQIFYRFMSSVFLVSARGSVASVSILAGGVFTAAALRAGKTICRGRENLLALFILTAGFASSFFGGSSAVSLSILFVFLHILESIRYFRKGGSILPSALFLLLALFSDPAAAYLLPGFIYLIVSHIGKEQKRRKAAAAGIFIVLCWVSIEAVAGYLSGQSPAAGPLMDMVRSSFSGASFSSIITGSANGLMIIGPAAAAAVLILIFRPTAKTDRRSSDLFATINLIMAVLLIASQQHLHENGIRWNALFTAGPAFCLYTAVIMGRIGNRISFLRTVLILTAAGLIHLIPIVLTNCSAERAQEQLLALETESGKAEHLIAESELEKRNYEKSERYYQIASEKDTTKSIVFYRLGQLNLRQGNYFDSVSYFGKALRKKPDNPDYRFGLAKAYIGAEWYTDAVPHLEKLCERFSSNPLYWTRLGFALNHSGEYAGAIRAYNRALSLEPDSREYRSNLYSAMLNRGSELQNDGRVQKAEELYREAISMVPTRWEGYFNLATIRISSRNYEEAVTILKMAVKNSITVGYRVYLNLGIVLEKMGRDDEALEYLKMAARMNPLSPAPGLIEKIKNKKKTKNNSDGM